MPQIILLTGVSGAGKSTLLELLFNKHKDRLLIPRSSTTREPKERDKNSFKRYEYLSKEEFGRKIKDNYFLESEIIHGNYYGTPKDCLRAAYLSKKDLILDIDPKGAVNLLNQKILNYGFKPVGIFVWRDINPLIDHKVSELIDSVERNIMTRDGEVLDLKERVRTAINEYLLVKKHQDLFHFIENDGKTNKHLEKMKYIYVPTFFPV